MFIGYNAGIMVERSTSLLEVASKFLSTQEPERKRRRLGQQFVGRARKLFWDFGPVKYKSSGNIKYPYIEPGVRSTPPVSLKTPDREINMHVEGDFIKDTAPNAHPNAVKPKRLALRLKSGDESNDLTIEFDDKGKLNPDLLPSSEKLQKGLDLLQRIEDGYEEQGLKINPDSFSTDHP